MSLEEAHYCSLNSQSNVYGLTKIATSGGKHKMLVASLRGKVVSLEFDEKTRPTSREVHFTYIPGIIAHYHGLMVYSVPTGQVVPTSGQVVDSTCECSGVSTTDFYQLTGSVQLKLLNDRCSTKLPLPRNPPLLEM